MSLPPNPARDAMRAKFHAHADRALSLPGAKWTRETGWTNEPLAIDHPARVRARAAAITPEENAWAIADLPVSPMTDERDADQRASDELDASMDRYATAARAAIADDTADAYQRDTIAALDREADRYPELPEPALIDWSPGYVGNLPHDPERDDWSPCDAALTFSRFDSSPERETATVATIELATARAADYPPARDYLIGIELTAADLRTLAAAIAARLAELPA